MTTISSSDSRRHDPTRRNVFLLCGALALSNTGSSLILTVTALAGAMLTREGVVYSIPLLGDVEERSLSTLALSVMFIGTMCATIPASLLMSRIGRRAGFTLGQALGVTGAMLSAYAIYTQDFWGFVLGGFVIGFHNAFWQFYRFAAADTASDAFRPKAISYVMAGPVLAGIFGPEIAKHSRTLLEPVLFAGSYVAVAGLCLTAMTVIQFLRIPVPPRRMPGEGGRPLLEIVRQPVFLVAVMAATIGYAVMAFLMTATPLAMVACGFEFDDAAFVIQWHVIGMFAPSFFTGSLIRRFGAERIILAGAALMFAAAAVNLYGIEILQFWSALVFLGVGWNFMFIGGTTLLTEAYRPEEKARVQGVNDFIVFGTVAFASLASGSLQYRFGWDVVNVSTLLPIALTATAAIWLAFARRRMPGNAA